MGASINGVTVPIVSAGRGWSLPDTGGNHTKTFTISPGQLAAGDTVFFYIRVGRETGGSSSAVLTVTLNDGSDHSLTKTIVASGDYIAFMANGVQSWAGWGYTGPTGTLAINMGNVVSATVSYVITNPFGSDGFGHVMMLQLKN